MKKYYADRFDFPKHESQTEKEIMGIFGLQLSSI